MDYLKTLEAYKAAGLEKKFKERNDYSLYTKELDFFDKIKSRKTGRYNQAKDLLEKDMVPESWVSPFVDEKGKALTLPVKYTNSIIRIKSADGSQWLKSRAQMYGLDSAGNPLNISMDDKELFDNILPIYKVKPENPRERDSKMVREVINVESRITYTEPFKPETVQKLYDTRNGKCTLVLKDESSDVAPVSVISLNDFMTRPFDELSDYLHTPRQKFEPSSTDENQKQYG